MTATYKGATLTSFYSYSWSPDEGMFIEWRERGRPAEIQGRAQLHRNAGHDVIVSSGGPYWDLVARRNRQYWEKPFVERWTLSTEILEKDLFSHPNIVAEMFNYPLGPARYRKVVEEIVQDGGDGSSYPGPESQWLIRELSRGVEAYEHEYHILSRTVTFDRLTADTLPSPYNMQLQLSRNVYSSSSLQANEQIPADVFFALPQDRSAAEVANDALLNLFWGWRIREQQAEIDTATTGMFRSSWVYAAWSTFLYDTPEAPNPS